MNEEIRQHLLDRINSFRQGHNLPPLSLDGELSRHAKAHSEHRVDRFPEIEKGSLPAHSEQHLWGSASAENVAWADAPEHEDTVQIADRLLNSWLSSQGHAGNILKARRHVGIDIAHRHEHGRRRIFMTGRFR